MNKGQMKRLTLQIPNKPSRQIAFQLFTTILILSAITSSNSNAQQGSSTSDASALDGTVKAAMEPETTAIQTDTSPSPLTDIQSELAHKIPPISNLQEAIIRLKKESPAFRSAEYRVDAATGRIQHQVSDILPHISASGYAQKEMLAQRVCDPVLLHCIEDEAVYTVSLTATQYLIKPAAIYAVKTTRLERQMEMEYISNHQHDVLLQLLRVIIANVSEQKLFDIRRKGYESSLEKLAFISEGTQLGSLTLTDLSAARQDVAESYLQMINSSKQMMNARYQLGRLLGVDNAIGVSDSFSFDALYETCRAVTLDDRPDIAVLKLNSLIMSRKEMEIKLEYLPTLSATTSLSASSITRADGDRYHWIVGGLLTVPLWDSGNRRGRYNEQGALAAIAEINSDHLYRNAQRQVQQIKQLVTINEAALLAARENYTKASELETLSRKSFELGRSTCLEFIEAGRQLRNAEVKLVESEWRLVETKLTGHMLTSRCDV